jgi:hypothetical protein
MQWNSYAMQVIEDVAAAKHTKYRAAIQLGLSVRTIERKLSAFHTYGSACFRHGNADRKPVHAIDFTAIKAVLDDKKLQGCNFTELSRLLHEYYHITVGDSTLRKYYYEQGILSPRCHRRTRRRLSKYLKEKQQQQLLSKAATQTLSALQHEEVSGTWRHPTKPRSTCFGERIEMDASSCAWIAGLGVQNLHVAIDDASGHLVGLWLEDQETLHGYFKITEHLLSHHGIPISVRTDKRTVFTYDQGKSSESTQDTQTQFASACSRLGIDLICNSDPDFKPKVERVHYTLQGMLPFRFALEGIQNVDQANAYLAESFIPYFNDLFGYAYDVVDQRKIPIRSVFVECTADEINTSLAVVNERTINSGATISYKKQFYALFNEAGRKVFLKPRTKLTVACLLDGSLWVSTTAGSRFSLFPVPSRYADEQREVAQSSQHKSRTQTSPYIPKKPPADHPWRTYGAAKKRYKKKQANVEAKPLYVSPYEQTYW